MIDWIFENKEWIFSGVGVFVLSGIIGIVIKYVYNKKKTSKSKRTINFYGKKSFYIEKNEGEVNINQ